MMILTINIGAINPLYITAWPPEIRQRPMSGLRYFSTVQFVMPDFRLILFQEIRPAVTDSPSTCTGTARSGRACAAAPGPLISLRPLDLTRISKLSILISSASCVCQASFELLIDLHLVLLDVVVATARVNAPHIQIHPELDIGSNLKPYFFAMVHSSFTFARQIVMERHAGNHFMRCMTARVLPPLLQRRAEKVRGFVAARLS